MADEIIGRRMELVALDEFVAAVPRAVRPPTGTVIFTVTNKGKISHNFKIAGKKTPLLLPRHSATLRVTFSKKGPIPLPLHRFRAGSVRHEGHLLGGRATGHDH